MRALRAALTAAAVCARPLPFFEPREPVPPGRDFYRNATELRPPPAAASIAAVVLSYNHAANAPRIARLLQREPGVSQLVVVEDGSTDGSKEAWRAALRPSDVMLESGNVHEIRAYNAGARAATAEVLCFLQDDDLPRAPGWAADVLGAFRAFAPERLALVSGLAGEACQVELGEQQVEHPKAMKNPRVTKPLGFEAELNGAFRPFQFATEAWLSPLCARSEVFRELGGFDETLAAPGEPGIGLDIHLSLRAGARGYSIGVLGAAFQRGVGGHGTVSDPAKAALRLRKRQEISLRIRAVAGCRWPPEMLKRADDLNRMLLRDRPRGAKTREVVDAQCAKFMKHPCRAGPR
mmetsp:Transcript_10382/g.31021  ORF Transcript_10382/g.31021 Transcript_10382/m.31021 type:complete len:350 (+) Transcript_10382:218-1267(+)